MILNAVTPKATCLQWTYKLPLLNNAVLDEWASVPAPILGSAHLFPETRGPKYRAAQRRHFFSGDGGDGTTRNNRALISFTQYIVLGYLVVCEGSMQSP